MTKKMRNVAVIGGGAAGLVAAITAARQGSQVTLLEAGDRVGSKILATGNGRCNLTNMNMYPGAYNAPAFVAPTLDHCPAARVRSFFSQLGLVTYEEREGRVYPQSNSANSVLDVLRAACKRYGVQEVCGFEVVGAQRIPNGFQIVGADGSRIDVEGIVVACGGGSVLLESLGHTLRPFQPVLCSLETDTSSLRGLSGVRAQAKVSLYDSPQTLRPFAKETGEVLFRDYGLSGIVIFDLSRIAREGQVISLDFMPEVTPEELGEQFSRRYELLCQGAPGIATELTGVDFMCGLFHSRLNAAILRKAKLRPSNPLALEDLPAIVKACKDFRLQVKGPGDVKHAQVTRGGALLDEFDPETLESRKLPGLYAAGECLDIDGRCGGYNLHWAWASGMTAGRLAARG